MTEPRRLVRALRGAPGLWRVAATLRRHGVLRSIRPGAAPPSPHAVRSAIEELGPVFMKLGQVLALRRDLLPDAYVDELEGLQDRTSPVGMDAVRSVVMGDLGAPPEQLFAAFSPEPLAAATIAQVHRARTHDGEDVVVKVQRPSLDERVGRDIAVIRALVDLVVAVVPTVDRFDPVGLVTELERSLRLELDFRVEARQIRTFREVLAGDAGLWIPDVVDTLSGPTVLTMQHSPGVRVDRYAAEHPAERARISHVVTALLVRQVFGEGLFHADPHPGNLFVLPDGRVCIHDFGMVGRLRDDTRLALEHLLLATVRKDTRGAADAYLQMGFSDERLSRIDLEEELSTLIDDLHARASADVSVGQALESLVRLGARHGLKNPGELLLLTRAFLITEGVLKAIDPEVDRLELFRGEMGDFGAGRFTPEELSHRAWKMGEGIEAFAREAPGDARRVLRRLADGTLGRLQAPDLEARVERVGTAVEQLTGGVVAGSFVIGGALLSGLSGWHHRAGVVLLGLGIVLAIMVGLSARGGGSNV